MIKMKIYIIDLCLTEVLDNGSDSIYLKRFIETIPFDNLLKTLKKAYLEIKNYIENIEK